MVGIFKSLIFGHTRVFPSDLAFFRFLLFIIFGLFVILFVRSQYGL